MALSFQAQLAKLGTNWNKAKARVNDVSDFERLPDGRYMAQLTGASLGNSQASGRLQVVWEWAITDGENQGETVRDFDGLVSEENLLYFQRKLMRLGFEVVELEPKEVEGVLKQILKSKPMVRLRLKTKGEYQNVYIDKLVEAESNGAEPEAAAEEEVEEAPKTKGKKAAKEAPAEVEEEVVEAEEEAAEGEEVELQKGMKVEFQHKGKSYQSVIREIDTDKGLVKVSTGTVLVWKRPDELTLVEEELEGEPEEEAEEAPKTKATKVLVKGKK